MVFMNPFDKIKETKKEVKEKILTLILAGFGLVAALAWNDAIQTLFKVFFPESEGVVGKFIYAAIVTVIIVFISSHLRKINQKIE
jgi:hypothetical protein